MTVSTNFLTSSISDQWTLPINFTFGKTIIRNGRPWKLSIEINYFFEQPDTFFPNGLSFFSGAGGGERID